MRKNLFFQVAVPVFFSILATGCCKGKELDAGMVSSTEVGSITVTVENPCAKDAKVTFSGSPTFEKQNGATIKGKSSEKFQVPTKDLPMGKTSLGVSLEAKLNALQTCKAKGAVSVERTAAPPKITLKSGTMGPTGSTGFECTDRTICASSTSFYTVPGSAKFRANLGGNPGDVLEVAGVKYANHGAVEIDLLPLLANAKVDDMAGKEPIFPLPAKATSSDGATAEVSIPMKATKALWELLRNIKAGPVLFGPGDQPRSSRKTALITDTGHWVRFVGDAGAAKTLKDVDLIVHNDWSRAELGTCNYTTFVSSKIRYTDSFSVYERTTGKKIASRVFAAAMPMCPQLRKKSEGDILAFPDTAAEKAWVGSLLK